MTTPVQILLAVADLGGHLRAEGDTLWTSLPEDTSPELKGLIRQHRGALMQLLRTSLLVVSSLLSETVFFTRDEETKQQLVDFGAPLGSIYTRAELEILVNSRVSPEELKRTHEGRQLFNGTVTR